MTKRASMIEQVAFGIFLADFSEDDWPKVTEDVRDIFRIRARAAIEAMREPTEAMLCEGTIGSINPGAIWKCMITEALKS